ncbi:MAG: hypothetical protein KatS3mg076_1170 [Candidatus Binatia bacterium]|nr:MAG: hypothetical protein KatS3mg076_1170 [Candidatus Binatia bacterium]
MGPKGLGPTFRVLPFVLGFWALAAGPVSAGGFDPALREALERSRYVYIQSQRPDGTFGRKAEIWYHFDGESVWVASSAKSYRVRRIRSGRTAARIFVGRPDGPSFEAEGRVVVDPAREAELLSVFSRKYSADWGRWEEAFRRGFASGERVLVRYGPKEVPPGDEKEEPRERR